MASTLRAHGPRVAHVRPLHRHSVNYAFSVFPSVRPATAVLQRSRDKRWRHMRASLNTAIFFQNSALAKLKNSEGEPRSQGMTQFFTIL